ncbi:MAG TPA: ribokinase [Chthonomonadales bacterium]|nr:ribokinase [Chthonomonadales bacterium]
MRRQARVVVVGSSNTDMVVKGPRIPAPGETVVGGSFVLVQGGKGANQAVACARLGARVHFVARVGVDLFGDRAVQSIGAAGVDVTWVTRDDEAPSGVALICVDEAGQNAILVAPGANHRLAPVHVDMARHAFADADIVVLQLEMPIDTVRRAIDLAKELGKQVLLNPAPARPVPDGFLRGVDVLTPNEHEASTLLGMPLDASFDGKTAALALLDQGVRAAIITLGRRGCAMAYDGQTRGIPARRVRAVDTTGAGDCFAGALACALAEGQELSVAAHFANAAAALSTTRMGAQPSMPDRAQVEAFMAKR